MSTRMQQRRGTASQWTNANPILAAGEIGFETDTNKFKIGDGVNLWADLSYFENLASLGGSFDDYILLSIKGEPLGVAELDADGQVPASQLGNATVDLTGYATETYVNNAVSDLIGAAPGALDTLNELAAAIGDDASFFTTIGTDITNAENAAKSYADGLASNYDPAGAATTAENNAKSYADGLAVNYDAAGAASTAETNANNYTDNVVGSLGGNVTAVVNGNLDVMTGGGLTTAGGFLDVDFTELGTHYDALGAASSAETSANLYTDGQITTALNTAQGYADTAESDAKSYADGLAANYDAAGTATTAVSNHNLDTTNVHGIADTSALALTADVNSALDLKANIANSSLTGTTSVEDLEISGALTFSGTATQIDSTNTTIADPMIYLGEGNSNNINDLGFVASFDDGTYQHAGLVRDASAGTWKLFKGVTDEPTTTVNFTQGSLDDLAVGSISATSATIGDVSNTELQYLNGVTSAVQTQIDAKAPIESPTFTGTVSGVTASMVGLGNVDNTTDANKPVSTATQSALDLKADLSGPTFSGSVSLPQTTSIGDVSATELGYLNGVTSGIQSQIDAKASTTYVDSAIAAIPAPDYTGLATETYADTVAANAAAAVVASAPAALDTLNELAAALGDDANFATTVTNAIAAKASTNAPTITNPILNITSISGLYSADEIINPGISGSIKLGTYSSTAYQPLTVGTFIKLVNSTSGTENIDNVVFEVAQNDYDAVFEFYYVRLLAVDSANYSAVDSWITSVYANGTSGMTFGPLIANTITSTEISYLDGVTSNIQEQLNESNAVHSTLVDDLIVSYSRDAFLGTSVPDLFRIASDGEVNTMNYPIDILPPDNAGQYYHFGSLATADGINFYSIVEDRVNLTTQIVKSSDGGKTWGSYTTTGLSLSYAQQNLGRIYYVNNKFYIFQDLDDTYFYSTDAVSWTSSELPVIGKGNLYYWAGHNQLFSYNGSKYVIFPNSDYAGGNYAYSTDGISWTQNSVSGEFENTSAVVSNSSGVILVWDDSTDKIQRSTDGVSWTSVSSNILSTLGLDDIQNIIVEGNTFIAYGSKSVGGVSKGAISYSTNGTAWSSVVVGSVSSRVLSIAKINTKYIAILLNISGTYPNYVYSAKTMTSDTLDSWSVMKDIVLDQQSYATSEKMVLLSAKTTTPTSESIVGKDIVYSQYAPSGGSDGLVWIKYL